MSDGSPEIVDWVHFERSRTELGPGFIRILSYFREDGTKSVADIEQAMREQDTVALIIPAHTLKGEARQFGAEPLATIAELIEQTARLCKMHYLPPYAIQGTHRFDAAAIAAVAERYRHLLITLQNDALDVHAAQAYPTLNAALEHVPELAQTAPAAEPV